MTPTGRPEASDRPRDRRRSETGQGCSGATAIPRSSRPTSRAGTGRAADGRSRSRPTTTHRTPAAPTSTTRMGTDRPTSLDQRRSTGRLCFNWYRITLTIPENASASFDPHRIDGGVRNVRGRLRRGLGRRRAAACRSGRRADRSSTAGTRRTAWSSAATCKPGQKIQLAVFGINGPISNPPTNFIWMRSAKLDFYPGARGPVAITPSEVNVEVVRVDPGDRRDRRSEPEDRQARRGLSSSPKVRSGCATAAICSSAIPTQHSSTSTPRTGSSRSSASRAATPAPTSPSTASPARTG